VYSDLYFDDRITGNGMVPFSVQFFEPGLLGALQSAENLLGACTLPFYRKYLPHVRESY
jgi:hypothetical protein